MIASYQYNDRSGIANLLDMIERHAPKLMRQGGGALSREAGDGSAPARITEQQRRQVIALTREGRMRKDVAARTGVSKSMVCKIVDDAQKGGAL